MRTIAIINQKGGAEVQSKDASGESTLLDFTKIRQNPTL